MSKEALQKLYLSHTCQYYLSLFYHVLLYIFRNKKKGLKHSFNENDLPYNTTLMRHNEYTSMEIKYKQIKLINGLSPIVKVVVIYF